MPPSTKNRSSLFIATDQTSWTTAQIESLTQIVEGFSSCPEAERIRLLHFCQRTGLDVFAKQVYLSRRLDRKTSAYNWVIITSIDGFRLAAHRAARADGVRYGYDKPEYYAADGTVFPVWLDEDNPPAAVTVAVVVTDERDVEFRYYGTARWKEYAQTFKTRDGQRGFSGLWGTMPTTMIEKCGEAAALRRAFPLTLGGVYIVEEFARADELAVAEVKADALAKAQTAASKKLTARKAVVAVPERSAADVIAELKQAAEDRGFGDRVDPVAREKYGKNVDDLDTDQAETLLAQVAAYPLLVVVDEDPGDEPRDADDDEQDQE